jgi:hypothetical protein
MPVSIQREIFKIVHYFKKEGRDTSINNKAATKKLLKLSGSWKDDKSADEQINIIYRHRKSRNCLEKLS